MSKGGFSESRERWEVPRPRHSPKPIQGHGLLLYQTVEDGRGAKFVSTLLTRLASSILH